LLRRSAGGRSTARSRTRAAPQGDARRRDRLQAVMLTDDWYPTLTKPNVDVVTERVAAVTPDGVRTADGAERPADVIVLATGFESHGFVAPMQITGKDGRTLAETWAGLPRAYLGTSVPGSRTCSCSTARTRTAAQARSSTRSRRAWSTCWRPSTSSARRRAAHRGPPRGAERFERELRAALAGTVWHTGARTGTSTSRATTPTSGPGPGARTASAPRSSSPAPTG
jgi:cation diffusion facilitator CzcD-associated flavoprotein CzcO